MSTRAKQSAGWSYPAKRVLKNDVSIITYQHSDAKHLENSLTRHSLEGFVKHFLYRCRIVTLQRATFDSARGFKNLISTL
jgi:hypothetical protein